MTDTLAPPCSLPAPSTEPAPTVTTPAPTFPAAATTDATARPGTGPSEAADAVPGASILDTLVPAIDYYAGIVRPQAPDKYGAICPDCKAPIGIECLFNRKRGGGYHKGRAWAVASQKDTVFREWLSQMGTAWLDQCFDEGVHPDVINTALRTQWHNPGSTRMQIDWARTRWIQRYGAKAYRGKRKTAPPVPQIVVDHFASWKSPYQEVRD